MSFVSGIDISRWQGSSRWQGGFDFAKAEAQGHKFCFCKASEGASHVDEEFDRNWVEGPRHGILVGAYHFYRPSIDPMKQVDNFLNKVGELRDGDLPCALDLEVTDGERNSTIVSGAKLWLDTVHERTGILPILYTATSYTKERGGLTELSIYPLWLAHYTKLSPKVPSAWKKWTFWQYTSAGHLDKNWFSGSLDELKAMAKPYFPHCK